jgi:hypothetical protein
MASAFILVGLTIQSKSCNTILDSFFLQKNKEKYIFLFLRKASASDYHPDNRSPPCEIGYERSIVEQQKK